jgi:hypothetical protein
MPGKTPMWGNPMRERDLLFSFRKVHNSSNNTFPAKRKTTYCCMAHPEILHLEICVNSLLYRLFGAAQQQQKQPQKPCLACLDFCSLFLLLYGLYGSVQYDLQQQKINSTLK